MLDLSSLSAGTTAAQALSGLVLVTPQSVVGYAPQNPPNPDGTPSTAQKPPALLFHYEGEQSVILETDITDHYVEDNTSRQDNMALRPETFTVQGFIGELNDISPAALDPVKKAATRLSTINAFAPQISVTAALAYAEAFFLYQTASTVANSAVSAWSSIGNVISGSNGQSTIGGGGLTTGSGQNKQQIAYQQFYGYWRSRTLFNVQTPWAVYQNMAIQRLRATQEADSNVITAFEITFKMIRVASTFSSGKGLAISSLDGRAASQGSGLVDLGTSSPVSAGSFSSGLSSMGLA